MARALQGVFGVQPGQGRVVQVLADHGRFEDGLVIHQQHRRPAQRRDTKERDPPRLATLTHSQEEAVTQLLEVLAFTDGSGHQASACRAIDEWWSPDALYRPARIT